MNASVLVLTFNEEANLPACLEALTWCDDIVVVDSGSTDETVNIARAFGARILTRPFDTFAEQRNFGLDNGQFGHDWVLHIDADEIVTPAFVRALSSLQPVEGIDAWRVPSKTMMFGRWLRHAGMWPTYQVRLGHAQRLRFVQAGHGQRENLPVEHVATFPEPYLHFAFSHGMTRWLNKHVEYARAEAHALGASCPGLKGERRALLSRDRTQRRRAAKAMAAHIPLALRPMARFLYVYVFRKGFLDGRAGLAYSVMLSVYEGMIATIAYEQSAATREGATASRVVSESGGASPRP